MKKVLFATTTLVATTGFAAADVTLSGLAQMGIQGGENVDTTFVQDIDVTFTMSGETDNGLTFGAAIDLDSVPYEAEEGAGRALESLLFAETPSRFLITVHPGDAERVEEILDGVQASRIGTVRTGGEAAEVVFRFGGERFAVPLRDALGAWTRAFGGREASP